MITLLPDECLLEIFKNFHTKYRTLFSCLLVNRHWCRIIIPILWSEPTKYIDDLRLIRIYLLALNVEEQALLQHFKIKLPNYQKLLFEYSNFATYVGFYLKDRYTDGVKNWLYKEGYKEDWDEEYIYYYDDYSYDDYGYFYQEFDEHVNAIKCSLISMFLRTSKRLKHLNIDEPICNKRIFEKLHINTSITSLKLHINNLEASKLLAEILYENSTLNSLDISNNKLGFKELKVLIKALCKNIH
ncbi:hypothetical protein C2G38_2727 [Gigaspora rosea]|uniref:F-box domain-containing protein n=1 Tax=Gigaspora rosea TaxID=44941 RepID=A0A397WEE4_9GLOM|nr:hypothetical protein C2G38_2727 [Gigaspora rosea]